MVILGNPPYDGYAGMAVDEDRELSTAYRKTQLVREPEGQGLNDLYGRFFRMAERRITEKTGQGVVCFISNYSWLDELSFTGMREHFLREFDAIRIDNLHGDRIISEYAPDGRTSETVFALRGQSPGIRVGTSIALLSKRPTSSTTGDRVLYRDFHQARADERREALLDSLEAPTIDSGFVRYAYRPYDTRWLYWEADTKLLDEKRADYMPHVFEGNLWLSSSHRIRMGESEPQTAFTQHIASYHLIERVANFFPAYLREEGLGVEGDDIQRRPNLSAAAQHYLESIGADVEDLFHHVLAVLHDPAYREANAGALRMEWPRIPVPGWPDAAGHEVGAAEDLAKSAARGRELAALLDSDTPVPGVTSGALRPEIAVIAVPSTTDGGNMIDDDFEVTAGWGHFGSGQAVMPGQGRAVERAYTSEEREAMGDAVSVLGETTFDIYLNDRAYWRNVPANVWGYKLGGYQVIKKWLSYRERKVLGRSLRPGEVGHFMEVGRRVSGILGVVGNSPTRWLHASVVPEIHSGTIRLPKGRII